MIYLDNSATTQMTSEVIEVMTDVMRNIYGNPSSLHAMGEKAERLVEASRKVIAKELHTDSSEIIFTSGGTEANNLAIKGVVEQYESRGRHLITTQIEHPSVYEVFSHLEKKGWEITYLPVDQKGMIDLNELKRALSKQTMLVSIMHVNNETGAIQPIEQIGQLLQSYPRTLFHVDAVQSFTKIPLFPHRAHVDLLSLSGHKIHGPKGVGALYVRKNLSLYPQMIGGGQEHGLRSGTYNVSGIAGFAKATAWSQQQRGVKLAQMRQWKADFVAKIKGSFHFAQINSDLENTTPYIINLSFPGLKSEVIVHALEAKKCYISSGSACSSKLAKPSRVLLAMGKSADEAIGSVRISLGYMNKEEDLQQFFQQLTTTIPQLQKVMKVQKT